jgi:Tfp pilus assembly protein PilN
MISGSLRNPLAFGTGVGIAIGASDMRVVAAKVRPGGVKLLGVHVIESFRERPAAEWGSEYSHFLRRLGQNHLIATVLLPRREVIVRQIALPGVADKDLEAAISFQAESLHPYDEAAAVWSYARIPDSPHVLVGIARRELVEQYAALFAEAGIRVSAFTFSAAAVYSAIRFPKAPAHTVVLAIGGEPGQEEIYGESEARPVFSAAVLAPVERAVAQAAAELRLPSETGSAELHSLLPVPSQPANSAGEWQREALPLAAALTGACPWLSLRPNLLPVEHRTMASRLVYVPTIVLALILAGLLVVWGVQARASDQRYLSKLQAEIGRLQPAVNKSTALDSSIQITLERTRQIDQFRLRTKADLDALAELTNLLQPPAWLNQLEMTRDSVSFSGEAEQAAPLLNLLDASPAFRNSEFSQSISRSPTGETFRIRAAREGVIP